MLIENLGNAAGFEQQFSTPGHAGKADGFVEKKGQIFIEIKSGRATLWRREFTSAIYHEFSSFGGLWKFWVIIDDSSHHLQQL